MHKEEAAMKKIGMLTSGGDCQALNAAMRGVVKATSLRFTALRTGTRDSYMRTTEYSHQRIFRAS